MSEQKRKVLAMLAEGKISVEDAERLLAAVERAEHDSAEQPSPVNGKKPKFLCVKVNAKEGHESRHGKHEHVNIRIPIALIKAGVKLGSVLPESARSKVSEKMSAHGVGLDLNNLDGESLDQFLAALTETHIDIEDESETVKICCE